MGEGVTRTMLYDYPEYYEVAFSFRDIAAETAVMHECIRRFSQVPVNRALEIGCGPAPHAGELARLGYHLTGIDLNPIMLDYATRQWRGLEPSPFFMRADMKAFHTPAPVDFVYVMLGSLYLEDTDELSRHLDAVASALRPGGLYFLDSCIQFGDPLEHSSDNAYEIQRDGITIRSTFDIILLDERERLYEEIWNVTVDDHGFERQFRMVEHNRAILPEEFLRFIAEREDFEFVGWWDNWDLERPIAAESKATRPLALVRRLPSDR